MIELRVMHFGQELFTIDVPSLEYQLMRPMMLPCLIPGNVNLNPLIEVAPP